MDPGRLDPDARSLRAGFERDGYVVVPGLLEPAVTAVLLDRCEAERTALRLPAGAAIVAPPLGDGAAGWPEAPARLAALLLSAPVELFGATFLHKAARCGPPALWHQDAAPWAERLGGAPAITVWVALEDADESNGCLETVPGSHRLAPHPLEYDPGGPSLFGAGMDPALVDESQAVTVPVAAGGAIAHHPALIHGSGPNTSSRTRTALALRYQAV